MHIFKLGLMYICTSIDFLAQLGIKSPPPNLIPFGIKTVYQVNAGYYFLNY